MSQNVFDQVKEYLNIKLELFKLRISKFFANIIGNLLALLLIGLFAFFFFFFLSFSFAVLLNHWLNSEFWGFIIIAGLYLILLIVVILLARKKKFQSWIEHAILNQKDQDLDED